MMIFLQLCNDEALEGSIMQVKTLLNKEELGNDKYRIIHREPGKNRLNQKTGKHQKPGLEVSISGDRRPVQLLIERCSMWQDRKSMDSQFESVQFRTTPMDSTGVPHILEHMALCGSQRFPCRDPFFKMLNRSLCTFMNAFTASDYTMYPFSTQNARDFQKPPFRLPRRSLFFPVCESWTSGGEPLSITDLTWKQLKCFHATHYHPSNASITDTFEAFTLSFLSSLMISGPNSPFYKTLIEPKFGTDFSSVVGYDGSTREASLSIGLQGVAEEDMSNIKKIISQTVDDIIETGFEEEQIEALLHKIEIQMKHQTTNFGLALASYIASCWNHDGDPVQLLKISENVSRFRQCLQDNPRYLQDKVQHYFKDNMHRLTLSMSPAVGYMEKQQEAELEKLHQKVQTLTDVDCKNIFETGLQLLSEQSKTQDTSCLPALAVSDIEPTIPHTSVQMGTAGGVPIQYCQQPTNGLVYFRALCNINTLSEDLKIYVPLFCDVITKLGCGNLDFRQQAQQMELKTGGMSVTPQVIPDTTDLDMYEQGVLLTSSCLERNLPDMFQLWSSIFNSPHFDDEERLRVLVMMSAQELSNGISDSGHIYAMTRAGRSLTPSADLYETFTGMDQVRFMKRIAAMPNLTSVLRKLPRIKRHLLNPDNMRCAVNATAQKMADTADELETFVSSLSSNRKEWKSVEAAIVQRPLDPEASAGSAAARHLVSKAHFKPCQMKTYFEFPFSVNFVSECVRTVPMTHADYSSLCILGRIMAAKFLHREIREKGGAYGGGAKMRRDGLFAFYSYRDPNCSQTLDAFRNCVLWAQDGRFTQQDVDEAKLSIFSSVDAPVAPSDKGLELFLNGVTDEMKQIHREKLFAVTHKSVTDVANRVSLQCRNRMVLQGQCRDRMVLQGQYCQVPHGNHGMPWDRMVLPVQATAWYCQCRDRMVLPWASAGTPQWYRMPVQGPHGTASAGTAMQGPHGTASARVQGPHGTASAGTAWYCQCRTAWYCLQGPMVLPVPPPPPLIYQQ
ncbi:Presequence protease, mitochondrial [Bagarius yarrelli]|uniref:Pitrilysin metalloproteinase 1 n=1 Tax=Bagarius yarrelli TaxID=175774 RepID=A0A556VB74_BAGYA|nr:Presequence protease, mitochondrial [Bagarius yarrelli]